MFLAFPRPQIICACEECEKLPAESRHMKPADWAEHSGFKAPQNWKYSIKMIADPEVPGAPNVSTWD